MVMLVMRMSCGLGVLTALAACFAGRTGRHLACICSGSLWKEIMGSSKGIFRYAGGTHPMLPDVRIAHSMGHQKGCAVGNRQPDVHICPVMRQQPAALPAHQQRRGNAAGLSTPDGEDLLWSQRQAASLKVWEGRDEYANLVGISISQQDHVVFWQYKMSMCVGQG